MSKKDEILKLYDYALALAEEYLVIAESHRKKEFLTDEGKEYEIKKLTEWKGKDLVKVLQTIQRVIKQGIEELHAKWEKQSTEIFADELLMSAVSQIKDLEPSEEILTALVKKYQDNPPALELIKTALKNDELSALVPGDYRAYNEELLNRTISALGKMTAEDLKREDFAPIELWGRRDFIENRLNDDLSLK